MLFGFDPYDIMAIDTDFGGFWGMNHDFMVIDINWYDVLDVL